MTEIDCREVVWEDHIEDVPVRVFAEPVSDVGAQVWVTWGAKNYSLPYGYGGSKESGYFESHYPDRSWWEKILDCMFGSPETFQEVVERKVKQARKFSNTKQVRVNKEQIGCERMKEELQ